MGATTIEWTATRLADGTVLPGYTFNPWIGCSKVAPECAHCYAEGWASRFHEGKGLWSGGHHIASDAYWQQLYAWESKAAATRTRRYVFAASLADLFEDVADDAIWEARVRFLARANVLPWLTFLLLTKRPQHVMDMVPEWWKSDHYHIHGMLGWPAHVWLGVTAGTQKQLALAVEYLRDIPAPVKFLSCEPLLEQLDLRDAGGHDALQHVDWVIGGRESGTAATIRPTHVNWARRLRDQTRAAGKAFFWQQWGQWLPESQEQGEYTNLALAEKSGGIHRWPDGTVSYRVKDKNLHLLDGQAHQERPDPWT